MSEQLVDHPLLLRPIPSAPSPATKIHVSAAAEPCALAAIGDPPQGLCPARLTAPMLREATASYRVEKVALETRRETRTGPAARGPSPTRLSRLEIRGVSLPAAARSRTLFGSVDRPMTRVVTFAGTSAANARSAGGPRFRAAARRRRDQRRIVAGRGIHAPSRDIRCGRAEARASDDAVGERNDHAGQRRCHVRLVTSDRSSGGLRRTAALFAPRSMR